MNEQAVPVIDPTRDLENVETPALLAYYKQTGDDRVKWEIVLRYEELVKRAAMQVRGIYSGFAQTEDIINEGLITLSKAIEKFDPDKGVKFETYVSKRIRGMVVDLARKQDWLPRNVRRRAREIDEVTAELASALGRFPTSAEVAERLQISEEKYQKDMASIAMNNVLSLDALLDAREYDSGHFELSSKDSAGMPEDVLEEQELREILTQGIAALQQNEQIVLSLYYVENLHLKDIAPIMGVSEPRISQIHTRAIRKLRKHLMEYYQISETRTPAKGTKKV